MALDVSALTTHQASGRKRIRELGVIDGSAQRGQGGDPPDGDGSSRAGSRIREAAAEVAAARSDDDEVLAEADGDEGCGIRGGERQGRTARKSGQQQQQQQQRHHVATPHSARQRSGGAAAPAARSAAAAAVEAELDKLSEAVPRLG